MKKILLLGGSAQQVIAIETAKKLGYYTILCDFLTDNPGQYVADKFYLESTTDKDKILEIAQKEKIDGILAYASDPAAPTAAYVAEKLNLPGNPYQSIENLCNKDKFRKFLQENGFNSPKAKGFDGSDNIKENIKDYNFPIIIKPVDSSGSKGVTVLYNGNNLEEAINYAFSFSRKKKIIVEEFIEKKHQYLIGGDLFVYKGKVVLWGLLNCHRDNNVNSLVPVGKSYPLQLEEIDLKNVKETLQNLIDKLNINSCGMNVELIVDKSGKVWPIDIGPRNGGNMIPDLLNMIFNVDLVEMAVKTAMNEEVKNIDINLDIENVFYATHNLHSKEKGIYKKIKYSEKLEKYIVKKCEYKNEGDNVEYFDNAAKALGIIFLKFDSQNEMFNVLNSINDLYEVELKL